MQDREFYEQIVGIRSPWYVERVELKLEIRQGAVRVYLAHGQGRLEPCSECGQACTLYDHQPERQWRHLDTCRYQTILHASPPRSNCPEHGPRVVKMSWAEPNSRFTVYGVVRASGNRLVEGGQSQSSGDAVGINLG